MTKDEEAERRKAIAQFLGGGEIRLNGTAVRQLGPDKVGVTHYVGLYRTIEQVVDVGAIRAMASFPDAPETHIYHQLAEVLQEAAGRPPK